MGSRPFKPLWDIDQVLPTTFAKASKPPSGSSQELFGLGSERSQETEGPTRTPAAGLDTT